MKKPAPGHYRKLLTKYPSVRIAFTHTPIIGCTIIDNEKVIAELKTSSDEFAPYYVQGLENKSMVAIVENRHEKTWANNGELYFKS